jgi:hypothetical protein
MDPEIDTDPSSKLEIQKAIKNLKNKKAPGTDQLNAELLKIDPVLALGMDSKVIPLQLLQLVKSPDFGILMMLPSDQLLGITTFPHIL